MANIAQGKLPLEKVWARPEEATDGKVTGYTGNSGYAEATHPATYTLDLGVLSPVQTIRFLLWDGLGDMNMASTKRDHRKYFYQLALSEDSEKWDIYYQTEDIGFNGWQVFEFKNLPKAKFVRLICKFNTANAAFQLVEFEVHNSIAKDLNALTQVINHRVFFETPESPNFLENKIRDLLNIGQKDFTDQSNVALNKVKSDAENIGKIKESLAEQVSEFSKTINQLNLAGKSLEFGEEADKNKKISNFWMYFSGGSFLFFIVLIFYFLLGNNFHFIEITKRVKTDLAGYDAGITNETLLFEFFSFLILKALLVSLSIYAIVFGVKNYKQQKHNYTVNQHKALSLLASVKLLDNDKLAKETKEQILLQATNIIFSHQNSGYNDKEGEGNPNIFANIVEGVKDKIAK